MPYNHDYCQKLYKKLLDMNRQLVEDRVAKLDKLENLTDVIKYYREFDDTKFCDDYYDMKERRQRHLEHERGLENDKLYNEIDDTIVYSKKLDTDWNDRAIYVNKDKRREYATSTSNYNSMFWSLHTDKSRLKSALSYRNWLVDKLVNGFSDPDKNVDRFDKEPFVHP